MKTDWLVKYLLSLIGWEGSIFQLRDWVYKRRFSLAGSSIAELIRQRRLAHEKGEAVPEPQDGGGQDREYEVSDELVVWATLIQLKARSLLPASGRPGADGEADAAGAEGQSDADALSRDGPGEESDDYDSGFDPAAWRRWVEGARAVQAAVDARSAYREQALLRFPRGGVEQPPVRRDYVRPVGRLHISELVAAWQRVVARLAPPKLPAYRSEPTWRLLLPQLVRWLRERREAILQEWARRLEKPQQVAAFLAFLELVRRGRVVGVQDAPGRPIRLVWAGRQTGNKEKHAEEEVS